MWGNFSDRLRLIEHNLISKIEYVEKFDALSLAAVDISDPNTHNLQLSGLVRLSTNLTTVFNEAYISQQSLLMSMKSDLEESDTVIQSYLGFLQHAGNIFPKDVEIEIQSSLPKKIWEQLPVAPDDEGKETNTHLLITESRRKTALLAKQIQRNVQGIHDKIQELVDLKLLACETIESCLETYSRYIASIANENGLVHSAHRISCVISPMSLSLSSHRFLDTEDAFVLLATVRRQWATAFLNNRESLAGRQLANNVSDRFLLSID